MSETNWAGNITYGASAFHAPGTLEELQEIVRRSSKLRALGSRHSFNRIADTDGDLVAMRGLARVLAIDATARTVTVEGGITYGQLCPALDAAGFALHNLASLPHIGVVGAVSTATHGSGDANKNLASAVAALEIITASGDLVSISRGDPDFDGAVVGLGALGVVSKITLDIQPSFDVRQDIYTDLPFTALLDNFDAVTSAAYSVSCFTAWRGDTIDFVWLKNLADKAPPAGDFFGAKRQTRPWHPLSLLDATPCTEQMGVPGPWYQRLPHFRMEFQPSAGAELQSEYFVARDDAVAALKALHAVQDQIAGPLMVSEFRTIAADDLWLSHNYKQDCLAIHFTWHQDWPAVSKALGAIETALAPFNPRPHWGKLFAMPNTTLQSRYTKLGDFRALAQKHDPTGKFRNAFVEEYVF
ncbi:MAG: FAD-binding protein [Devosia sp.]